MDLNQKKEQFNIAYIQAIAAQAGLRHSKTSVDDDSVDIELSGKSFTGLYRNPKIELQLKCTSQLSASDDVIKFTLKKKNYDDLRGTDLICPRYLVVLVVPEESDEWIIHQDEHMSLHNLCYYISIKGHPEILTESKVIDIPKAQRLTTEKLLELLQLASNGH